MFNLVESRRCANIAVLTLSDPPANTFTYDLISNLDYAYHAALFDPHIDAIIFTGSGSRFFSGGVNIGMLSHSEAHFNSEFVRYAAEVFNNIAESPKLTVAAINGHVTGGGLEFALLARHRVAIQGDYNIGLPEVKLGVIPGLGGTQRLTKIVGLGEALRLITQGMFISTDQAKDMALIEEVYSAENFLQQTIEFVNAELKKSAITKSPGEVQWKNDYKQIMHTEQINHLALIALPEDKPDKADVTVFMRAFDAAVLSARRNKEVNCIVIIADRVGSDAHQSGSDEPHWWRYVEYVVARLENYPGMCVFVSRGELNELASEIALACDYRFIYGGDSGSAYMQVHPRSGRLFQWIDKAAHTVAPTSSRISATQALQLKLATGIQTDDLRSWVVEWASQFVPPLGASKAIGYAKLAIRKGTQMQINHGMALEQQLQEQLMTSHDGVEGMKAYLEKRRAKFAGE